MSIYSVEGLLFVTIKIFIKSAKTKGHIRQTICPIYLVESGFYVFEEGKLKFS